MAEGSPVPLAQKPYDAVLAPGWITIDQSAGVTVTEVPLRTAVPLQLSLMVAVDGSVKRSVQLLDAAVPALRTVNDRQKPPTHAESLLTVAASTTPLGADPIVYNTNRPHTAHGDQTPAEFAAALTTINEREVA